MFSKEIFFLISSILLFLLAGCFIESLKRKTETDNAMANVCASSFLSVLFFLLGVMNQSYTAVYIFYSLFYLMMFVTIVAMLHFVFVIEGHRTVLKAEKIGEYVFFSFSTIDLVLLVGFPSLFFELRPIYSASANSNIVFWCIKFKKLFLMHEFIELSFSLKIITTLIFDIKKSKGIRKENFKILLAATSIEQIFNIFFIFASSIFKFNYTPIVFGFIAIYIFDYSTYKIPRILKDILSSANEKISDAVICFDYKGNFLYSNEIGRKLYAVDNGSWVKKYVESEKNLMHEHEVLLMDGEFHTFSVNFKKLYDEKKRLSCSYLKLSDRTFEISVIERENYRATHDELTKLYNRSYFFNQCEVIINRNPEVPRYMIASNIRNFKLINDLFGTKFGDDFLIRQAEMFNKAQYKDCIKARISSDRFAMLIRKSDFNPQIAVRNTDFVREIGASIKFPITMQLGLYEISDVKEMPVSMYNKAVLAFKRNNDVYGSKCTFSVYDSEVMNKLLTEKNIIHDFEKSLTEENFKLFLQAQIESQNEKCVGAEVLVRWFENGKFKNPDDFIPVLEKSGLIYKLDYYVWEKTVQLLKKWQDEGKKNFYLSVNISMKDFYFLDLYDVFTDFVKNYGISPGYLNLEFTESVIMDKDAAHYEVLNKLREFGFKIEMDDFGSGYSSLNILKDVKMDVLKIDKEFLHQSGDKERTNAVIVSVIQMAKALGMKIVVEGVETEIQKDFLKQAGADIFQGFYYSRPISVEDFEQKYLEVEE